MNTPRTTARLCCGCCRPITANDTVSTLGLMIYHRRCAPIGHAAPPPAPGYVAPAPLGRAAQPVAAAAPVPAGQRRDRLAASLLAFFLGGFGAHWFYLGDRARGKQYMAGWIISLATIWLVIGYFGILLIACMCLFDFVTLLSMEPAAFDAQYN